jgi:hypothetical protein
MGEFGLTLILVGFVLILWGGAELARKTGAGLPPGGCALAFLLLFAIFRTKAGLIGLVCLILGWLLLSANTGF